MTLKSTVHIGTTRFKKVFEELNVTVNTVIPNFWYCQYVIWSSMLWFCSGESFLSFITLRWSSVVSAKAGTSHSCPLDPDMTVWLYSHTSMTRTSMSLHTHTHTHTHTQFIRWSKLGNGTWNSFNVALLMSTRGCYYRRGMVMVIYFLW